MKYLQSRNRGITALVWTYGCGALITASTQSSAILKMNVDQQDIFETK